MLTETIKYTPKNIFATKTYVVTKLNENESHVKVESPFLGKWNFKVKIPYDNLIKKLTRYSYGEKYIQNVFPNLLPAERELFLTDPSLWNN